MRHVQAAVLLMLSGILAAADALAAIQALPVAKTIAAQVEQRSIRPGDEASEATILNGRLVLDPPRWYLRLTDPDKDGWRQTFRGNGRMWEDIEVLGPDAEPRVERHQDADAAMDRQMALVRRDLPVLAKDFVLSATAAAGTGYTLLLIPRDAAWSWARAELHLNAAGQVQRAEIDEREGVHKTITVSAAQYDQPVDPALFAGLDP